MREVVRRALVDSRHGQYGKGQGQAKWAVMYVRLRFVARLKT